MQFVSNALYLLAGVVLLILAKGRTLLRGYRSPKPFGTSEWLRCATYDIGVVDKWLLHLADYAGTSSVAEKSVLELGPGSDLGTGLYLLSKRASSYVAVDVNNLAPGAPNELYETLFGLIANDCPSTIDILRDELRSAQDGRSERLKFIFNPELDLSSSIKGHSFDLIFSQAAFEHFGNFDGFVKDLSLGLKAGTVLIAEVDLCSHSRWIRDRDELNIYRYSDRLYRLLTCSGSPNRLRPYQYREIFEKYGWTNLRTKPLRRLNAKRFASVRDNLAAQFKSDENEMDQLSIIICATKV